MTEYELAEKQKLKKEVEEQLRPMLKAKYNKSPGSKDTQTVGGESRLQISRLSSNKNAKKTIENEKPSKTPCSPG